MELSKQKADKMKKIEASSKEFEEKKTQQKLMRNIEETSLIKTYKAALEALKKNFLLYTQKSQVEISPTCAAANRN